MSCLQSLIQSKLWVKIIVGVVLGIAFSIVATYIATPAITGVGVIILGSVLTGVGVPTEGILLVISIDRILRMFRTAFNVTGDLTACLVFNKRI